MKGIRLHWSLHPEKSKDIYKDAEGKLRSPWYDSFIEAKMMTPSAVARELDISYELSVEGIVYPEFRDSHILRRRYEPNPALPVYRFIDFGRVNACTFCQVTNLGTIVFFHEIVLSNSNTEAQARAVQAYSLNIDCSKFVDFCDPSGFYAGVDSDSTSVDILRAHDIDPTAEAHQRSKQRLIDRTERLKQKLRERNAEGGELIRIVHTMNTTIDAFQSGYRYNENIRGEILDTIKEEHPYEDVIDCVSGTVFEISHKEKNTPDYVPILRRGRGDKYTGY